MVPMIRIPKPRTPIISTVRSTIPTTTTTADPPTTTTNSTPNQNAHQPIIPRPNLAPFVQPGARKQAHPSIQRRGIGAPEPQTPLLLRFLLFLRKPTKDFAQRFLLVHR
ncbi:hypothetical protein TorRG33x02_152580 [Trema orientale]|uniref:Uncharacterized protein n=1 Tax=Trema orientale TaxID=63057 RepID=A0A2P5EU10_TREOI|nr:hypothetical protein TorRG33x02_152580 [Trema orientale]